MVLKNKSWIHENLLQQITDKKQSDPDFTCEDCPAVELDNEYHGLLDSLSVGIQENDLTGKITYCNDAYARMFGYEKAEILEHHYLWHKLPSEQAKTELKAYLEYLISEQPEPTLYTGQDLTKSGEIIDVQCEWNYKRNSEGLLIGFTSAVTDITERKRASQLVDKLASIVEFSVDAIVSIDLSGSVTTWNKSAEKLFQYSTDEILGKPVNQLVPDHLIAEMQDIINKVITTGENVTIETIRKRKDGSEVEVALSVTVLKDNGQVVGTSAVLRDITERKAIERSLIESEHRFRNIFDSIRDGIAIVILQKDKEYEEGAIIEVNNAFCQMLGYAKQEVIGKHVTRFLAPNRSDDLKDFIKQVNSNGFVFLETVDLHKDGRYIPVELSGIACEYMGHLAVINVVRDITERKKVQVEMQIAKHNAEVANKAKSGFLSRMSHELRTPLNAILGFAQLQKNYITPDMPEEMSVSTEQITAAGKHLLVLVNDVLDIVSIEQQQLDIPLASVDLDTVINESLALVKDLASTKEVDLIYKPVNFLINSNSDRLRQVIVNLLTNAIKYNHQGGQVNILAGLVNDYVRLSVVDTGIGIDSMKFGEIFQPFTRLALAYEQGIDGTGIGLALSKFLVEQMGCKIGVSSSIGEGSTFWVDIPLDNEAVPERVTEHHSSSASLNHTVLYIEDDPASRQLMKMLLDEVQGLTLMLANSAEEGILLAKEVVPDLIFIDINLPGMSGLEIFTVLKAEESLHNTRMVALSANAMKDQVQTAKKMGFDEYMTKPVDVNNILKEIKAL